MFQLQREDGLELIRDYVSKANLSRIYGFILYTEQHPYVVNVLRNDAFWAALDSISGPNWPIFSVKPLAQGSYRFPSSGNGYSISFLVPRWVEPQSNLRFMKDFGLDSTEDLPCIVAFIWDDNDELQSISIPIKGTDESSTYNSIEEIVRVITKVENNINPEYKRNVEVFRNVSDELKTLDFKNTKLKSLGTITKRFAEFLSLFV